MSKVGVLGEQTATTVGTHTVHTVPSGKGTKAKIMLHGLMASTGTLAIAVNGITVAAPLAATTAANWYSNANSLVTAMSTPTLSPDGASTATTVAPAPAEYYLAAGDTVTYTLGVVNATSMNIQVVGVEVDVE